MSSTTTNPATSPPPAPTIREGVFIRFRLLLFIFVHTFINLLLHVSEYYQSGETQVDLVYVAWSAGLLVLLTVIYCVWLATFKVFSVRAQLIGITAACWSGALRIPGLKVDIYTVSWLFYNFALPYLWDALLTELGMPGMVYAKTQPARPAQPKPSVKPVVAVQPHDGKSSTLSSTRKL
ncbi:hypothetical protein C8R44DRAFT_875800 [Mycena epipterygia]|nr:hypothetical protein C8R44DRAFT_875800 [Mycena epipterygia]